ncbi:hypothetical protein [Polyangium sp. y55x31]|uniref:hypothetical protein n=1 Tax=Polyangium sp. y55x31 TaxID=3042688 RepID=UPI002482FC5D|nr:hypothetical protein [Polyangium sp. y55x31]MDI1483598.1 hypothetical protein [Polyangium sp. y55x31]
MSHRRFASWALLAVCFSAVGCGDHSNGTPYLEGDLEIPFDTLDWPSENGLETACFWDHDVQQALRDLGSGAIVDIDGSLPSMPNLPPPGQADECRETILKDLVFCTLPEGDTAEDPDDNSIYKGGLGLAPGWRNGAFTTTEKEWVTACLMQHVNGLGAPIKIVLEGNHSSIYVDSAAAAAYPEKESTTWGNLFDSSVPLNVPGVPPTYPAFTAYVCREEGLDCDEDMPAILNARFCDGAASLCGFSYQGSCSSACTASGPGNNYWTCGGQTETIRSRMTAVCQ